MWNTVEIQYQRVNSGPSKHLDTLRKNCTWDKMNSLLASSFSVLFLNTFSRPCYNPTGSPSDLCVFVRGGFEVVATGREQKQRTTTLNSCRNSNLSLTETLQKPKELISIPATTIPKYTTPRCTTFVLWLTTTTRGPKQSDDPALESQWLMKNCNPLADCSPKNNYNKL